MMGHLQFPNSEGCDRRKYDIFNEKKNPVRILLLIETAWLIDAD